VPWNRSEPTWGVVVVHGVGVSEAGESLAAFMGGVTAGANAAGGRRVDEIEAPQVRMLREAEGGRFPMHVRLAEVQGGQDVKQAAFAEVYWGDLTKTGDGTVSLILQLLTAIFNARYLIDRAAAYPAWPQARLFRVGLLFASWILCGMLPAAYLLVLFLLAVRAGAMAVRSILPAAQLADFQGPVASFLGLVVLLASLALYQRNWHRRFGYCSSLLVMWSIAAVLIAALGLVCLCLGRDHLQEGDLATLGVAALVVSGWLLWQSWSRKSTWAGTWRLLLLWLLGLSAGLTLVALLGQSSWLDLSEVLPFAERLRPSPEVFSRYVSFLISVVLGVYVFLILLLAAYLVFWVLALRLPAFFAADRKAGPPLDAALAGFLVQVGVWGLTFQSSSLFILDKFPKALFGGQEDVVNWLTHSVLWHLLLALGTGLVALAVWLALRGWACWWHRRANRAAHANEAPRLLLSGWLVLALIACAAVSCASTLAVALGNFSPFDDWVNAWGIPAAELAGILAIGLTIVSIFARNGLRAGLHVVMDVISHFYRPHLPFIWKEPPMADLVKEFTIQQWIEWRFKGVLKEMLHLVDPGQLQRLTFVTHSQGTVIAIDVLWQKDTLELLKEKGRVKRIDLVTMGSPLSHLYQNYFPDRYPALLVDGKLNAAGWGTTLTTTVDRWLNLYRVDDFVGTFVTGGEVEDPKGEKRSFPANQFLVEGGHTSYWGAADVQAELGPYLP
jgi:hypothetical protein